MTETPDASTPKRRSGGLSSMLIADLKSMAVGMGISGASSMKKAQLVEAIKAAQSGAGAPAAQERPARGSRAGGQASDGGSAAPEKRAPARKARTQAAPAQAAPAQDGPTQDAPSQKPERTQEPESRQPESKQPESKQPESKQSAQRDRAEQKAAQRKQDAPGRESAQRAEDQQERSAQQAARAKDGREQQNRAKDGREQQARQQSQGKSGQDKPGQDKNQDRQGQQEKGQDRQGQQAQGQANQSQPPQSQTNQNQADGDEDHEDGASRRSRRRRGRDRATGRSGRNEPDTTILEDDVLVPAAGILDVLDNYAFVRTSGYLPGTDDVYLSLSLVKKYGLRRGDAVVGQVRQPREGERREKFNPMVRIDQVNGAEPDSSRHRAEFDELTPVHPDERLRLEAEPTDMVGRVIDIASPLGKGQRAVVVAEPRSGRTVLFGRVAAALTRNNPECHLMIVLVDARPEEVTDFRRAVKGEVIASTFDRAAGDHTLAAELAVERAKRLVELGHDVVVLLDSLTALTRAYNQTVPASGRTLAGGVDPVAVQASKRLLGAARNVEDGGSLTLLTTLTAGGSQTDEVILEELANSANSEVHLSRDLAERGLHPAVDVVGSGTRREDVLVGEQEAAILQGLRRSLAGMQTHEATEKFLTGLSRARTNIEYLTQVQRTLG